MKKIFFDTNDVLRDYSRNFLKIYYENYNHDKDFLEDFEFWTNNMENLFNFQSHTSFNNFVYYDYPFEIFGKCPASERNLTESINMWIDKNENLMPKIISLNEGGLSIGNTLFFYSKLGLKIRDYAFPKSESEVWNECDILVTANPNLMINKPEGKIVIKINTEYNSESPCDYSYDSLVAFLKDNEVLKNIENESK